LDSRIWKKAANIFDMEEHKALLCMMKLQVSSNKVYKNRGDMANMDINWKYCVVKQERRKMRAWGLAPRKNLKVTPSRTPGKPLLKHRVEIGVFIGLFLLLWYE